MLQRYYGRRDRKTRKRKTWIIFSPDKEKYGLWYFQRITNNYFRIENEADEDLGQISLWACDKST